MTPCRTLFVLLCLTAGAWLADHVAATTNCGGLLPVACSSKTTCSTLSCEDHRVRGKEDIVDDADDEYCTPEADCDSSVSFCACPANMRSDFDENTIVSCVPKNQCGCLSPGEEYLRIGDKYKGKGEDDLNYVYTCAANQTFTIEIDENPKCPVFNRPQCDCIILGRRNDCDRCGNGDDC